jgi:PST family polysaccharide transporter
MLYRTFLNSLIIILKIIFGFILTKIVAVQGGPVAIAQFSQFQTILSILQNLPNGSSNGVVANTPNYRNSNNIEALWGGALVVSIIIYILLLSISITLFLFYGIMNDIYSYILIAIVLYPLCHIYSLCNAINTSHGFFYEYFVSNIISVSSFIILLLILHLYFDVGNVYYFSVLFFPFCSLFVFFSVHKRYGSLFNCFRYANFSTVNTLLKFVLLSFVSVFFTPVIIYSVREVISSEISEYVMGNWQSIWRISEVYTSMLILTISSVILPRFSYSNTKREIVKTIIFSLLMIFPIYFIVFIVLFFWTDPIFHLLYSESFVIDREVLVYQLSGDFFKLLGSILTFFLLSASKLKILAILEILFGVIFISGVSLFVAEFGVLSVSIIYLLIQMSCAIILTLYSIRLVSNKYE